jgi:hypothetical protein
MVPGVKAQGETQGVPMRSRASGKECRKKFPEYSIAAARTSAGMVAADGRSRPRASRGFAITERRQLNGRVRATALMQFGLWGRAAVSVRNSVTRLVLARDLHGTLEDTGDYES